MKDYIQVIFKVQDRAKRKNRKESMLCNLNMTAPIDMLPYIERYILTKCSELDRHTEEKV